MGSLDLLIRLLYAMNFMDKELAQAFIDHMNAEFESYYLYLSMRGYMENESWEGFSHWLNLQAEEEREHAMKFYDHLLQRGEFPKLLAISQPEDTWESPLAIFEASLGHEKKITSLIHELMDKAIDKRDHAAQSFLKWFVDEQLEEEDTVGTIVDRVRRVQGDPKGLMLMDAELASRNETGL